MAGISKENIARACAKLAQAPEFCNLKADDLSKWIKGNGELEDFMAFAADLPQAKMISQSDALAWLYSFDHREKGQNRANLLENLERRLAALTPYECAVIMREMEGQTPVWHRGRGAEDIRRSMFLKDLYSGYFSSHDKPSKRLVAAFWPQMFAECRKETEARIAAEYGSCENFESRCPGMADGILALGRRYRILECDTKDGGHLLFPCIFAKDGRDNDEFAYAPEAGALALAAGGKLGGAFIVTINPDPESYEISVGILTREQIEIFREKAAEAKERFWRENVAGNAPFEAAAAKSGKTPMEGDAALSYARIAQEMGRLHMAKKMIEERQDALKAELDGLIQACARDGGVTAADIQPPQGMVGMMRKRVIDREEAGRILDSMPEANNIVISKLEPDKEMMIRYMEEHGVAEHLWKAAKIDPDLMIKFCRDNNIDPPVRTNVVFSISTSKKSREQLGQAANDIQPLMDALFRMEEPKDDNAPAIDF